MKNEVKLLTDRLVHLVERRNNLRSRYLADFLPSIEANINSIERQIAKEGLEAIALDRQLEAYSILTDYYWTKETKKLRRKKKWN